MYKQKPSWKCVLDTPEKPPVEVNLKWVGRPKELAELEEWAKKNIANHLLQSTTKQKYRCPLVHGGLGVGTLCWSLQVTDTLFFFRKNKACGSLKSQNCT